MSDRTEAAIPNDQRTAGKARPAIKSEQQHLIDDLVAGGVHADVAAYRVLDLGLTREDVDWNRRLGRPMQWKETVNPAEELKRRQDWHDTHPGEK